MGKIAIRLKDLLDNAKQQGNTITMTQLAEMTGMHRTNLYRWMKGEIRSTRHDILAQLCEILDCQPGDLLTYDRDGDDHAPD